MEEINRRPYRGHLEPNQVLTVFDPDSGEAFSWYVYRVFSVREVEYAAIILMDTIKSCLDLPEDQHPERLPVTLVRLDAERVQPLDKEEEPGVMLAFRMMEVRENEGGDIRPTEEG